MVKSAIHRVAAGVSGLAWLVSLALPSYATPIEEIRPGLAMEIATTSGWELALMGWAGPLEQFDPIFAWYANPVALWCVWRLAIGRRFSFKSAMLGSLLAFLGTLLALSGLSPTHIEFGDDHGVNGLSYPLVGAYVWVASFTPLLIAFGAEAVEQAFAKPSRGDE